jgi:peptidoglycan-associated lipoprotein
MKTSTSLRALFIAVPVMTMMACSSGPSEEELAAERNRIAAEQAEAQKAAEQANAQRVQAEAAQRLAQAEEMVQQERAALEAEQTVYFDFDRSSVKADFYAVLDKHAAFLVKNAQQTVVIQGHTDSRGTPEYNIALGERRAQAVETYLLNAGVSASQISVVSFGEEKPAVTGASEYAMAQNRRAVVIY